MRDDKVRGSFTQEVALENAPKQEDGSFLIPSILGEGAIANGAHLRRNGHSRDSNRSRRQAAGKFSAAEVARGTFERIGEADGAVHAFLETTEELALDAAARIDAAVAEGRLAEMGPLAGVPVGYKDNLNLTGTHTTCSSNMLRDYVSPYTATCVEKTLRAGALPIGKLNMDEFAFGGSTETSAFGPTFNPWDVERVPGGKAEAPRPWRRALCRCRSGRIRAAPSASRVSSAVWWP